MPATDLPRRGIPDATVARLPDYLRALTAMSDAGVLSTSSEALAAATRVGSAMVRKDLSFLGSHGVRGVGYDVTHLGVEIARVLGLPRDWPVLIVGMGNLGRALAAYGGFAAGGFRLIGLLDRDPQVVGQRIAGLQVSAMSDLAALASSPDTLGVITTPAPDAQTAADALIEVGITSILNFAAVTLTVPESVDVRKVDVATELQILAFHKQRRRLAPQLAVAP